MTKKSQAAMEFLMTYGWAILVVLVVIGALAYFGVLDPTSLLPEKCVLQPGPLACEDSVMYSFADGDSQLHLRFKNVLGDPIDIKKVKIIKGDYECESSHIASASPGQIACVALTCPSVPITGSKAGFEVEITYSKKSGLDKIIYGDISKTMQSIEKIQGTGSYSGCPLPTGDGNGDGIIDSIDLDIVVTLTTGVPVPEALDLTAYDLDCDGVISAGDRSRMMDTVAKPENQRYDYLFNEKKIRCCFQCSIDTQLGCDWLAENLPPGYPDVC